MWDSIKEKFFVLEENHTIDPTFKKGTPVILKIDYPESDFSTCSELLKKGAFFIIYSDFYYSEACFDASGKRLTTDDKDEWCQVLILDRDLSDRYNECVDEFVKAKDLRRATENDLKEKNLDFSEPLEIIEKDPEDFL